VGKDVALLAIGAVIGAVIGLVVKALIDPVLERRKRRSERLERWLEDSLDHADHVLAHIQQVRSINSARLAFDGNEIAREVVRSLTTDFGPGPFNEAAKRSTSDDLRRFAQSASEAWTATRFASMDDEHGVAPAREEHEPLFAVQWYETQVSNFAYETRRILGGESM
jgi:hypothetical protein